MTGGTWILLLVRNITPLFPGIFIAPANGQALGIDLILMGVQVPLRRRPRPDELSRDS